MLQYHNFIGIDIGKYTFVISDIKSNYTKEYENNNQGIKKFIIEHKDILPASLCILETTGGYERAILETLCRKGYAVHRADTRKVKSFIRSYGNAAKTDKLDAKALVRYGKERAETLKLYRLPSEQERNLFELVQRKSDLKQMLVAEKNRFKSPSSMVIRKFCSKMIAQLDKQICVITEMVNSTIEQDPILKQKREIIKEIPGIGNSVAAEMLVLLPELGKLNRRQIASLAGLAPRANDSGMMVGYRKTAPGRNCIKPVLFLAAMAARNSKTDLKGYYEGLIARGKKKMVALTALMRKILIRANAKLKFLHTTLKHS